LEAIAVKGIAVEVIAVLDKEEETTIEAVIAVVVIAVVVCVV
jgi:hypothetical protein